MIKKTFLFSLILIITSCAIKKINYTYDFKTIQKGIDFTQSNGLWFLNIIDIPEKKAGRQVNLILSQLNKWTKNNTVLKSNIIDKGGKSIFLNLSKKIEKEQLNFLKEVTNYKYFMNVRLIKNVNNHMYHTAEMMFDVYDISKEKLILSERIIGNIYNEDPSLFDDDKSFKLTATPNLISGLIKKGLKRIEKNSKY